MATYNDSYASKPSFSHRGENLSAIVGLLGATVVSSPPLGVPVLPVPPCLYLVAGGRQSGQSPPAGGRILAFDAVVSDTTGELMVGG